MRSVFGLALVAVASAQTGDVLEVYSSQGCTGTPTSVTSCKPGTCCYVGTTPTGSARYAKMSDDMQFYCKLTGHVEIGIHDNEHCSTTPIKSLTASNNAVCTSVDGMNLKYIQKNKEYSKFLCGLRQGSVEYYIQVDSWMQPQCMGASEQRYALPLSGFGSSKENEKMDRAGKKLGSCPEDVKADFGECGVIYNEENGCAPEYVKTDWSCDLDSHIHIGNRPYSDPQCTVPKTFLGTMLRVPTTHLPITGECVASVEGLTSYRALAASNYTMIRMCDIINADPTLRETLKFMPYQDFIQEYPIVKNSATTVMPSVFVVFLFLVAMI